MIINYLLLLLVVVIGGYSIFKIAVKVIRRIDVTEKINLRRQRKDIYNEFLEPMSSEDDKEDKKIKEDLSKFINKDF